MLMVTYDIKGRYDSIEKMRNYMGGMDVDILANHSL